MNEKDMARVFDFKTTKIRLNCERFSGMQNTNVINLTM